MAVVQASLLHHRPRGVQPVLGHLQQEARARALPAHPVGRPARIAAPARVRRVHGEHRYGRRLEQQGRAGALCAEVAGRAAAHRAVRAQAVRDGRAGGHGAPGGRRCRGGCERRGAAPGGCGRAGGGRGICRSGAPQCAGCAG